MRVSSSLNWEAGSRLAAAAKNSTTTRSAQDLPLQSRNDRCPPNNVVQQAIFALRFTSVASEMAYLPQKGTTLSSLDCTQSNGQLNRPRSANPSFAS